MKFDRFDFTIWGLLGGFALALIAVVASSNLIGARTVRTFPPNGGEVGPSGRIGLEFAQSMQAQTVEPLFQIEPATPGKLQWDGRQMWFIPGQPFQPGVHYIARLKAGALSQDGQAMKLGVTWRFQAHAPWIVYLSLTTRQLWRIPSSGGEAQPLTKGDASIYEFAVSPDGQQIAYSLANDQRGVDIWLMSGDGANQHMLVQCGASVCAHPAWSPDGTRTAYNHHGPGLNPGSLGPPRVWIVEIATGQSAPLYEDPQIVGANPSWSPDGKRVALLNWFGGDTRVLNLQTHEEMALRGALSTMGTWSADGNQMLFPALVSESGQFSIVLNRADFTTQTVTTIPGQERDWSGVPAWSPAGDWVVVGRRLPGSSASIQLWLMQPDGQEGRFITNDPKYSYSGYQWDPWGQAIAFLRSEINQPGIKPDILVWSMAAGQTKAIASDFATLTWQP